MIMHQTNRPHQTHPRTVAANPGLECSSGQTELLEWLQTARDWTPDTAPTWMERLRNEGVQLPPPENADESAIADLTLRLILSLAERGVYAAHLLADRALANRLVAGTAVTVKVSGQRFAGTVVGTGLEPTTTVDGATGYLVTIRFESRALIRAGTPCAVDLP